jgi:Fe-S-cluster-containing dehydrogenase component
MTEINEKTILVDLQRCIGCWTCSLACKVGNGLPDEDFWLTVRTEGSGEGIDRPAGTWPNLHMSWIPIWSQSCVKCPSRVAAGEKPYCVNSCPCSALTIGDEAAAKKEELRDKGFRFFELPAWEKSVMWLRSWRSAPWRRNAWRISVRR